MDFIKVLIIIMDVMEQYSHFNFFALHPQKSSGVHAALVV